VVRDERAALQDYGHLKCKWPSKDSSLEQFKLSRKVDKMTFFFDLINFFLVE